MMISRRRFVPALGAAVAGSCFAGRKAGAAVRDVPVPVRQITRGPKFHWFAYYGIPDPHREELAPKASGIWHVDLDTGQSKLVISLAHIAQTPPLPGDLSKAKHWFNHLLVNPDGTRFEFLHRWKLPDSKAVISGTRMFTAAPDGSAIRFLNTDTSHFNWRDPQRRHRRAARRWTPTAPAGCQRRFGLKQEEERYTAIMCRVGQLLITAALASACPLLSAAELYVAANGSDANPGTQDQPFASLERARDEIRKSQPGGGATVFVRGGLYWLPNGILFEKHDSGTEEAPIVYRAFQGEKPVLIGGRPIAGFTGHKGAILMADVGSQGFQGVRFRQLFFDGKRQIPARYPNFDIADPWMGGWAYVDGKPKPAIWAVDGPEDSKRTFPFKPSDARTWAHPEDGWVLISPKHEWDYAVRGGHGRSNRLPGPRLHGPECRRQIRKRDPGSPGRERRD